jgi:hypothetical protein
VFQTTQKFTFSIAVTVAVHVMMILPPKRNFWEAEWYYFYMTQTQQNLLKAYAGESQARNKYSTFAKMARKENFEWIARVFEAVSYTHLTLPTN